jgi:hypothetical protein
VVFIGLPSFQISDFKESITAFDRLDGRLLDSSTFLIPVYFSSGCFAIAISIVVVGRVDVTASFVLVLFFAVTTFFYCGVCAFAAFATTFAAFATAFSFAVAFAFSAFSFSFAVTFAVTFAITFAVTFATIFAVTFAF